MQRLVVGMESTLMKSGFALPEEENRLKECRKCTVSEIHKAVFHLPHSRSDISRWFRSGVISSISNVYEYKCNICVAAELIKDAHSSSSVQSQLPALSYPFIKSSCVDLTGENILSSQPKEIKWKHYSVQSKH